MSDVPALACAVLAIARRQGAPPDPSKENAADGVAAPADGVFNFVRFDRARRHISSDPFWVAIIVFICSVGLHLASTAIVESRLQVQAPQSSTAPVAWQCADTWSCDIAGLGRRP